MPVGTPIVAPFGGTITVEDHGHQDWGKRIFLHLSNGYTFAVGHLTRFAVTSGQVSAGQVIGYSGGDPSDPSSGLSTGPHVEVQWIDSSGKFTDPAPTLSALQHGTAIPGLSGTSTPNNIISIITSVAQSLGIDPAIALATASLESRFNPNAIGDSGHSVGLFQLHDQGEGAGMSVAQREDPTVNAQIALTEFARVRANNPSVVNNPGLWAALAQRPGDPTDYAAKVNQIYGDIKSGKMPIADYGAPGGAGFSDYLKQKYPSVFSAYNQYFGQDPTSEQVQQLIAGGTDPNQITDAVRALPSHIQGINQGQYVDLRTAANSASQAAFAHDATDGIVAELFSKQITSAGSIKDWYDGMSANDIAKDHYQAIVRANQPSVNAIYNENGFDPRIAAAQYNQYVQQAGGTPVTSEATSPTTGGGTGTPPQYGATGRPFAGD
jgi:hypothetical protein